LYGCEKWSFTLKEEHRLKIHKNRALRRMFGTKKKHRLYNEELHNLYTSLNIIREIKSKEIR